MLTESGCRSRQSRLWNALPESVEWVLIADPRHVQYLCNFWVNPISFSHGERGLLLLEREHGSTLLADNFSLRSAASTPFVDREVDQTWYDHRNSVDNRDHALIAALKSVSERLYGYNGAVEAEWLPVGAYEVLGLDHEQHSVSAEPNKRPGLSVDLGTTLRELRRQKEADEIALLKQCMQAGDAGHARAREFIEPGVTDLDVYREVQSAAIAAAGRPAIVYGDFRATNAKTFKAGGLPANKTLEDGDMFILDYSVMIDGYRSDFTNTYAVGKPSDEQEMIFRLCEAALAAGEASLRAGVAAKDVFAATTKPFDEAGYGPLTHHAGHGLGLGHPEAPILVPESTDSLIAGDVVTIEPGLYIEGIGGVRIENNYLILDGGAEKLNNHLIALT
ncbi:M24 family metallopeptidase [Thalassoroseus pseudoceratinae]|uniref:M24 family metallopeptidase n=1 Tax=Thalassoroseus pseudoceratinae TaxID=2713176 RepID=UPI001420A2E6|nr:Xaa-Pro peptidase family protein [Thalassoroseus pseudoceratinae]